MIAKSRNKLIEHGVICNKQHQGTTEIKFRLAKENVRGTPKQRSEKLNGEHKLLMFVERAYHNRITLADLRIIQIRNFPIA